MYSSLDSFFAALDTFETRVPLDQLVDMLRNVEIHPTALEPYQQFSTLNYQRNLIREGSGYQALLLCWSNGQRSPIHDHIGSSCAMRIIEGTALETSFERGPNGLVYATGSRELKEGYVCGSQDDDIHQVSNLQGGNVRQITLHIYSPPLIRMNVYSLTDPAVRLYDEPINVLVHGAGL